MTAVSIIIPAWNESKTLRATLDAVRRVDYDKESCEVIVVAGGEDNTYGVARDMWGNMTAFQRYVTIIQAGKGTKNAPVQQGLREAQGTIVVLLDADVLVHENWLKSMVDPIELGVCDITIANSEPVRKNWISDFFMINKAFHLDSIVTYPGHSMAFKASIVDNRMSYFFDETIWMLDDYVFQKRMAAEGYRTMFIKEPNVKAHFPSSLKYFWTLQIRWMTASIVMEGIKCKPLTQSIVVVTALITLLPVSRTLFVLSLLFNILYVAKKVGMFARASRLYATKVERVFGFVFLSYLRHIIFLVCHIRYFLGLWEDSYYQGERY